jgi:hypothetical protein
MASLQRKGLSSANKEKMLIWNWDKYTSHYRQREREREREKQAAMRDSQIKFPFFLVYV